MPDSNSGPGGGKPPDGTLGPDQPAGAIRLRGLSSEGDTGTADLLVGRAGFNNHSLSFAGSNIVWIESTDGDASGVGRLMHQRYAGGLSAANDNPTWVADRYGAGVVGCDPTVTDLMSGDTLLTWVGADGNAHGRMYAQHDGVAAPGDGGDAPEYAAVNASLADLGPVVATPDGGRRLQVTEPRPGSFAIMWLALANSSIVLRGSVFTPAIDAPSDDDTGHWSSAPIAEIRLPNGFTGQFTLQAAGDGTADFVAMYTEADPHTHTTVTLARRIDASAADGGLGQIGPEFVVPAASATEHATTYVAAGRDAAPATAASSAGTHAAAHAGEAPADTSGLASKFAIGSGILVTPPIVKETLDGFVVAWETPGASQGAVTIQLALFDADGAVRVQPDGTSVITVTDNAAAGTPPSIAGVGHGAAVGYVEADQGSLILKAYDGTGAPIGDAVVVDSGEGGAISDISLGSGGSENSGHDDQVAVVYVRDDHDDQSDYGNIMLQRYGFPAADGDRQLEALGGDGVHDGADAPIQLTSERDGDPDTTEAAVGRAPTVMELDDGDLAIVWVENTGTRETMRGSVLESNGQQVLRIDLTDLLADGGIAKGTKPTLLATHDGDIIVSWLQSDGHGFVVMAALYEAAGAGTWIAPEETIRLRAFDDEPKDYSVTLSQQDGLAIDVFWRPDSSGSGSGDVLTQRFDIDGNDLGRTKTLASTDDDHNSLPTDTLSAAGLVDGQIVVVYAEENRNGTVDLAAHVIDTRTDGSGHTSEIIAAGDAAFLTAVDQEIALNLLPDGGDAVAASYVNGMAITPAAPIDVGHGWVQLRDDGQLTVSPDTEYTGEIKFEYTIGGALNGSDMTKHVTVNVVPEPEAVTLVLKNSVHSLAEDVSTSSDVKLAEIAASDGDLSPAGLSVAGLDADLFKIVGTTLYMKAGIDLDFETKPTLSVEIRADSAAEPVNFMLGVEHKLEGGSSGGHGPSDVPAPDDTFMFAPGFGDGTGDSGNDVQEVIDVSSSGYRTLQELLDSGALVQAGEDVVLTFDPSDPAHSDRVTLRGVDLSVLTSADFKF